MSDKPEQKKPSNGHWGKVDLAIWASRPPLTKFQKVLDKASGIVRVSTFWIFIFAAPFFVMLSFMAAYSLAGVNLFGPVLLLLWGGTTVAFVWVMEKSGYARNFEDKTFKLSLGRILAIPLSFLVIVGGLYLLLLILRR